MRRVTTMLILVAALGACKNQRSFDDRYANTAKQIEGRARAIDAQLNATRAENGQTHRR